MPAKGSRSCIGLAIAYPVFASSTVLYPHSEMMGRCVDPRPWVERWRGEGRRTCGHGQSWGRVFSLLSKVINGLWVEDWGALGGYGTVAE